MRRILLTISAAWCVIVALGCGGTTEPEVFNPVGEISFTYSGAISGSFSASGTLDLVPGAVPQAVTGATAFVQDSVLALIGFRSNATTVGDLFVISLGRPADAKGTVSFDPLACQQQTAGSCRAGVFIPDISPVDLQLAIDDPASFLAKSYILAIGNVTVTEQTALRIRGTFAGTAVKGGEPSFQNLVQITKGTFDLPVRPNSG